MPRGLPASPVNRRNRPLRAIRPSTSMELSDGPVKNPFFRGRLKCQIQIYRNPESEIDNARI